MTTPERWPGRIALMVTHCAGMIDLVALPIWIGVLVAQYQFDPQQAGGLATLFLLGAVTSSLFFAPRFQRFDTRRAATIGFSLASLAFIGIAMTNSYAVMGVLHTLAGAAAACALSFTHGTIGRCARPHRMFAMVGMALGIFAVLFLGATPKVVEALGGASLFWVFGAVMLTAAVVSALAFPNLHLSTAQHVTQPPSKFTAPMVFGAVGIACMALVQAMVFSFLERMGADRGFSPEAVMGVLIALGIVNLFPASLAAVLEKRLDGRMVLLVGPIVQASLALLITHSASFAPYATAGALFAAVLIFTHTFAFGVLAGLDPSGRLLAATPAMLMAGSAVGPILGGTLVKMSGYSALGIAASLFALVSVGCFSQARLKS